MKKNWFLLIAVFFASVFCLHAQWQLIDGLGKAKIHAIGYDANNWYAILGSGLFRSTNDGNDWEYYNNMGYVDFLTENCIFNSGDTIFIGSKNGIYYSTDAGQIWELLTQGLVDSLYSTTVAFGRDSKKFYILTNSKLFTFDINEKEFTQIEMGKYILFRTLNISEKYMIVGSWSHTFLPLRLPNIFISKDRGITWEFITDSVSGIDRWNINCFASNNDTIYAGTSNGIFVSYDEGSHWELLQNSLSGYEITNILITNEGAYAGTKSGMFYASEIGSYWEKKVHGLTDYEIISMSDIDGKILAGTGHGLFFTTDKGDNWISINHGLGGGSISEDIKEDSGKMYTQAYNEGLFSSIDSGKTWQLFVDGSKLIQWGVFAIDNNVIYNASNRRWMMLYSLDRGNSWNIVPDSTAIGGRRILHLFVEDHNVIACTDKGIFISEDSAKSWYSLSPALEHYGFHFIFCNNNDMFAGSIRHGLFKSTDKGVNWKRDSTNFGADNVLTEILKAERGLFVASYGGGVFKSTDKGMTWDSVNNGLNQKFVISLAGIENNIFASTQKGIFLSTNSGDEWEEVSNGLTTKWINKLLIIGDNIFAGSSEGLFKAKLSDFGITNVNDSQVEDINWLYCYPPYPNPAQEIIRSSIYWDPGIDIEKEDIAVYDIYGNRVAGKEKITIDKQTNYNGILEWDCSSVSSGIYFIHIKHGTRDWTIKVMVNR
jgi:photosystem II stability/assembly factor-like uncharacterized protein